MKILRFFLLWFFTLLVQLSYAYTVVIDPGHGGKDCGAFIDGIKEKNINLEYALLLKEKLESYGINVILTRDTDKYVSIYHRKKTALDNNADLMVSIHTNGSSYDFDKKGIEIFYPPTNNGESSKAFSKLLATYLMDINTVHIEKANIAVLKNNRIPAVLIEIGYLSNLEEQRMILSQHYMEELMDIIAYTINLFLTQKND